MTRSWLLVGRIAPRLLAFNVLLVFLPIAGLFLVDTFEKLLLDAQERAMIQQVRVLAAALGGQKRVDSTVAYDLLRRLEHWQEGRLRVVDRDGILLADSTRLLLAPRRQTDTLVPKRYDDSAGRSWLYRIGAVPFMLMRKLQPPQPAEEEEFYAGQATLSGREVRAALAGGYGAATRVSPTGQRSVTLYTALPIRNGNEIIGAVLASQSTHRILQALYLERLTVFEVFLTSLLVAAGLSLIVSTTLVRPLRRLRDEAGSLVDHRGRLRGSFSGIARADEIGDLARALAALTTRLERHISFIERFSADVAHEFRNPLAAIRASAELAADVEDDETRRKLLTAVEAEVARLERLLAEVREISRLDAGHEEQLRETIDLDLSVAEIVAARNALQVEPRIEIALSDLHPKVAIAPDLFFRVVTNLLDNAASFAARETAIDVTVDVTGGAATLTVSDRGPGIPAEHLERVFDRFFSYRPDSDPARHHSGLGLAIVRAIIESAGGTVTAWNRVGGGACFALHLPLAERTPI
jgi:two-component system sensor histidine kinase ChvG